MLVEILDVKKVVSINNFISHLQKDVCSKEEKKQSAYIEQLKTLAQKLPKNRLDAKFIFPSFGSQNFQGSLLSLALIQENIYGVEVLLQIGASPNIYYNRNQYTCLLYAALALYSSYEWQKDDVNQQASSQKIYWKMVELLLESPHLDPNLTSAVDGKSALHYLCINDRFLPLVEKLHAIGANLEIKNHVGDTPLHFAVKAHSIEMINFLITRKCDVNVVNDGGRSPLHIASMLGNQEIIALLLKAGAHVNKIAKIPSFIADGYLETPLSIAANRKFHDIVVFLVNNDAEINVPNVSPLIEICRTGGEVKTFQYLMEKGADCQFIKNGENLLEWAVEPIDANLDLVIFLYDRRWELAIPSRTALRDLAKKEEVFHYLQEKEVVDPSLHQAFFKKQDTFNNLFDMLRGGQYKQAEELIWEKIFEENYEFCIEALLSLYRYKNLSLRGVDALILLANKAEFQHIITIELQCFIIFNSIELLSKQIDNSEPEKTKENLLKLLPRCTIFLHKIKLVQQQEIRDILLHRLYLMHSNLYHAYDPDNTSKFDGEANYKYYLFMRNFLLFVKESNNTELYLNVFSGLIKVIHHIAMSAEENFSHNGMNPAKEMREIHSDGLKFLREFISLTDSCLERDYVELYLLLINRVMLFSKSPDLQEMKRDATAKLNYLSSEVTKLLPTTPETTSHAEPRPIIRQKTPPNKPTSSESKTKNSVSAQQTPPKQQLILTSASASSFIPQFKTMPSEPKETSHHKDRKYMKLLKEEIEKAAKLAKKNSVEKTPLRQLRFSEEEVRNYFKEILQEGDILKPLQFQNLLGVGWAILRLADKTNQEAAKEIENIFDRDEVITISNNDGASGFTYNPELGFRIKSAGTPGYRALSQVYNIEMEDAPNKKSPFLVHFHEAYKHKKADEICKRRNKSDMEITIMISAEGDPLKKKPSSAR